MNSNIPAWFSNVGCDDDVILSTRIRSSRNVRNYAFPLRLKKEDGTALRSLVLNTLNSAPFADVFSPYEIMEFDDVQKRQLEEYAILPSDTALDPIQGLQGHNNGNAYITINIRDHMRISTIRPGFEIQAAYNQLNEYNHYFDQELEIATVNQYGLLTSHINTIGTGLKFSVLSSLPGLFFTDTLDKRIKSFGEEGLIVKGYYTPTKTNSLGWLFLIATQSAAYRDPISQFNFFSQAVSSLIEEERTAYKTVKNNRSLVIEDTVVRSFLLAKNARLVSLPEAMDLIFKLKLGLNCNLLTGIEHNRLNALLFYIQSGHLATTILKKEKGITMNGIKIETARAQVMQNTLANVELINMRRI